MAEPLQSPQSSTPSDDGAGREPRFAQTGEWGFLLRTPLRDRLASLALVELMRRPSKQAYALADFMTAPGPDPAGPYDDMAREAYAIADAMLRAREASPDSP